MTNIYTSVADALRAYALALHAAWAHPSFAYDTTPARRNSPYSKQIVTRALGDGDPTTLPRTGRLVRGARGVGVEAVDQSPGRTVSTAVHRASVAWRPYPSPTEDEAAATQAVKDAEARVTDAMATIPGLLERVYDISGFKNWDTEGIRERIAAETPTLGSPGAFTRQFALERALGHCLIPTLEAAGCDPHHPAAFDDWDHVIDETVSRLRRLAERETWAYDVVALLNAPALDHDLPMHLVDTTVAGQTVALTLESASDSLLNEIQHREYNLTGVGRGVVTAPINAALRYRVEVPVHAPMRDYVRVLEDGVALFTRVVDVLRLVRADDVGIVGVESFPAEPEAPTIRYQYDVGHNPTYASVTPRRSYFFLESAEPLSDEALGRVRRALPSYLDGLHGVQGLEVAVRRYRDSRERHRPGEPESLLDLAVALEAVLLNDAASGHGELGYRLALRAARLVGGPLDVRKEIFSGVRDLYTARSKLAHGTTLDAMKERDARRVHTAVDLAPALLRLVLLRFLTGRGPSNLKGDALADWWRSVELGDGSPFDASPSSDDP